MWINTVLCLLIIGAAIAKPQNQETDIQDLVNNVFTSPRTPTTRRPGFGQIVTPEPVLNPTEEPQILTTDAGKCICVPYYLCDPDTNTIRTDGETDGFGRIDIRFNPDSCQEVLDVCCLENKTVTTPIEVPPVTTNPNRPKGCGIRNVGGLDFQLDGNFNNEAGFGEFPWTVALILTAGDKCICGGSLIHPQVVLTGNHCVRNLKPGELKIRAGEWDTQTTKERLPYQELLAKQIVSHPQYNAKSLANDFALVELEKPFELADHIATICLPPANQVASGQTCYASGWGKDVFGKAGKYSVIMKSVPLPIVPNNPCETSLRGTRLGVNFILSDTFICAGGQQGVDTCEGDGGAPLVCPVGAASENRYAQNGIVAWGIGCNENLPAVYANVAIARIWIDQEMQKLGYDGSSYTY